MADSKEFSPLIETGALGEDVLSIVKGYSNRLVLQIEVGRWVGGWVGGKLSFSFSSSSSSS